MRGGSSSPTKDYTKRIAAQRKTTAKLVLVDTIPWKVQADFALTEAQRALSEGLPVPECSPAPIALLRSQGRRVNASYRSSTILTCISG
ncbi:hypothetical protein LFL97_20795 [Burkholderia sp. JSH-S8]|nr:hypothetical protein LFL97_20795 [Burkholderia sp. JSH-S8]